jgi:hypothetical protein
MLLEIEWSFALANLWGLVGTTENCIALRSNSRQTGEMQHKMMNCAKLFP